MHNFFSVQKCCVEVLMWHPPAILSDWRRRQDTKFSFDTPRKVQKREAERFNVLSKDRPAKIQRNQVSHCTYWNACVFEEHHLERERFAVCFGLKGACEILVCNSTDHGLIQEGQHFYLLTNLVSVSRGDKSFFEFEKPACVWRLLRIPTVNRYKACVCLIQESQLSQPQSNTNTVINSEIEKFQVYHFLATDLGCEWRQAWRLLFLSENTALTEIQTVFVI